LVVGYGRFGIIYRSHPQGSSSPRLFDTTTDLRCVKSQKTEDLVYTASEAWNYVWLIHFRSLILIILLVFSFLQRLRQCGKIRCYAYASGQACYSFLPSTPKIFPLKWSI